MKFHMHSFIHNDCLEKGQWTTVMHVVWETLEELRAELVCLFYRPVRVSQLNSFFILQLHVCAVQAVLLCTLSCLNPVNGSHDLP